MTTQGVSKIHAEQGDIFINNVGVELSRAKRYSIFVTMSVLDLTDLLSSHVQGDQIETDNIISIIKNQVRDIDQVSYIDKTKLGLLFPETPRQGAEVVIKRISTVIKDSLLKNKNIKTDSDEIISIEIASYPDAAGARTINEILEEWQDRNKN